MIDAWMDGCHVFFVSAPGSKHVIKLRMKPDDPSVDLNHPAVKAGLLREVRLQNPFMSWTHFIHSCVGLVVSILFFFRLHQLPAKAAGFSKSFNFV